MAGGSGKAPPPLLGGMEKGKIDLRDLRLEGDGKPIHCSPG